MHIIVAVLTSLVTALWILHRLAEMGVDLGGLNPWLWRRRRRWKQKYEANPVFALERPMEASALLITAVAKSEGDMTSDERQLVLKLFEDEFHLSDRDAAGLLSSSVFLLRDGTDVRANLEAVLEPSIDRFTADQASSAVTLMKRVASASGEAGPHQTDLVQSVEALFDRKFRPRGKWE
ncbi:MAG: TerB family tellurite resistance protein [Pseudomonadota bacterium]